MGNPVLVLNSGSSSLKYKVFDMPAGDLVAAGTFEEIGTAGQTDHDAAFGAMLDEVGAIEPVAVGHRVVFGGERFTSAAVITEEVVTAIRANAALAPLHNPHNLAGILAAQGRFPDVVQVACFDTAFHMTIPPRAHRYAIPEELYRKSGLRRYGFHGVSHEYVATVCAARLGIALEDFNAITCHLGNGCSMTAILNGRSVDTSMGLTPLAGLVMGTRSGDIDPGVVLHLARQGMPIAAIDDMLNRGSGLAGLSRRTNDVRDLLAAAPTDPAAQLALDVFAHQARRYLGSYAAQLPRIDAVVFTGGIGERSPALRAMIIDDLNPDLGIALDVEANVAATGDVTAIGGGKVAVWVIPTDEEWAIADATWRQVASG